MPKSNKITDYTDYNQYINKKFNKWEIIKVLDEPIEHYKKRCICKCGCGTIREVRLNCVVNSHSKSCGCIAIENKNTKLLGKKFHRLTVLECVNTKDAPKNKKLKKYWRCLCECGNKTIVSTENLNNGNTKSCGCLMMEKANGIHYSERNEELDRFRPLLNKIKAGRGKIKGFNLTLKYINELWNKQEGKCPFLGIKLIPSNWDHISDPIRTASLDRIDSSKGYVEGNVMFVSMMINYAKNKYKLEELIDFLKLAGMMWSSQEKNIINIQNINNIKGG